MKLLIALLLITMTLSCSPKASSITGGTSLKKQESLEILSSVPSLIVTKDGDRVEFAVGTNKTTSRITASTQPSASANADKVSFKLDGDSLGFDATTLASNLKEKLIIAIFLLGIATFFYFAGKPIFSVVCIVLAFLTMIYPFAVGIIALCVLIYALVVYKNQITALIRGTQLIKSTDPLERAKQNEVLRGVQTGSPEISNIVKRVK